MNFIICFCLLFIGILLFWEFSKILLIKTVETLSTNESPPPKKIGVIQYTPTLTSTIQSKINEVIEECNKLLKEKHDSNADADKSPYVPIKEMDLSTINGISTELLVIQLNVNMLIVKVRQFDPTSIIIPVNISNIATTPKKLNAIKFRLNLVINAVNKHIDDKDKEAHATVSDADIKSKKANAEGQQTNDKIHKYNLVLKS